MDGHYTCCLNTVKYQTEITRKLIWLGLRSATQGYYMIKNAGTSGALMQKENPQQVATQFVNVESSEDYITKAKQLGARVVKDKQEIPGGY